MDWSHKFGMYEIIKNYRYYKGLNNTFSNKIFFSLFNSLFIPYIQYGLLLWGSKHSNVEKLQRELLDLPQEITILQILSLYLNYVIN